jgi:hypothetical protein
MVAFGVLLLSYGNTKNHPTINGFIVESFLKNNNKENFSKNKFKNYLFDFEKPRLKGDLITKAGLFNPSEIDNWKGDQLSNFEFVGINPTYTEESREISPKKWIEHGGYSADVPEVPASLRHFYDPTRKEGERYLTDKVNSKIMSWFQSNFKNPNTDGVEWALGEKGNFGVAEHMYTWEHGKKYMKGALEESNPDKRKKYMANAWRSLGETLHMIADNGCPSHVRNDGHPSIPIPLLSYFGNPDPYEENLDIWQNSDENALLAYKSGTAPTAEVNIFRKVKTAREIAHELAVFTNKNFFTNETISGTDWKGNYIKQTTHPEYEYKSPKLNANDYEKNYYRKEIAGQQVLICTDTWFFNKYPITKTDPYIDEECVKSQAKILIPTITEAGANVMKLFIPELKVTINSIDENGNISGQISHITDSEYKEKINYNGPVSIKTVTLTELANLKASNGKFSGKISDGDNANLFAEIEFGGVTVKSETFKRTKTEIPATKKATTMDISVRIFVDASYTSGYKDNDQIFHQNGNRCYESWGDWREFTVPISDKFKGIRQDKDPESTIEGAMTDDKILWLKIKFHEAHKSGGKLYREEWWEAEIRNIPLDSGNEYGKFYHLEGWDFQNEKPNPEFKKSLPKLEHKLIFYPSKQEISISSINYTKTEAKTSKQLISHGGIFLFRPGIEVRVGYNIY